jgi:hypothetical protein
VVDKPNAIEVRLASNNKSFLFAPLQSEERDAWGGVLAAAAALCRAAIEEGVDLDAEREAVEEIKVGGREDRGPKSSIGFLRTVFDRRKKSLR